MPAIGISPKALPRTTAASAKSASGAFDSPHRPLGRRGEVDQPHVVGKPLQILRRALDHQGIADFEPDLLEPLLAFAVPVQREGIDAVAAAQPRLLQAPADQPRAGGQQHFDDDGGAGRDGLDLALKLELDILRLPQGQKVRALGMEDDDVSGLKRHRQLAAQRHVAAQDVEHPPVRPLEEGDLVAGTAGKRAAGGDQQLDQEARGVAAGEELGDVDPVRDEEAGREEEIEPAHGGERDADRGDLEQRELRKARRRGDAVDEEIGGGPDQRAGAAEDRREGQRHQEPRRIGTHRPRKTGGERDHHDHQRRVVDEGRGDDRQQDEGADRDALAIAGEAVEASREVGEHARAHQRAAEHEHRDDRPGRGIGESADHVLGIDQAEQQRRRHAADRDDLGAEALARKGRKEQADENERDFGSMGL